MEQFGWAEKRADPEESAEVAEADGSEADGSEADGSEAEGSKGDGPEGEEDNPAVEEKTKSKGKRRGR